MAALYRPLRSAQPTAAQQPHANRNSTSVTREKLEQKIPKILHYAFSHSWLKLPPMQYKQLIATCVELHPSWEIYLWRDGEIQLLMRRHYPHHIRVYNSMASKAGRTDVARYLVLHRFGGVYLDMDVRCLKPLDQLLHNDTMSLHLEPSEQAQILYNTEYMVLNAIIGCVPQHPFMALLVSQLTKVTQFTDAVTATGPVLLTQLYKRWLGCSNCTSAVPQPITVYPSEVLSPVMDGGQPWKVHCLQTTKISRSRRAPLTWKDRGCLSLQSRGWQLDRSSSRSFALHVYLHLGFAADKKTGLTFDIFAAFPNRIRTYT